MDSRERIAGALADAAAEIQVGEIAVKMIDAGIARADARLLEVRALLGREPVTVTAPVPAKLMTVREAASVANCDRNTLYALVGKGQGPAVVRVGSHVRIHPAALDEWLRGSASPKAHKPGRVR